MSYISDTIEKIDFSEIFEIESDNISFRDSKLDDIEITYKEYKAIYELKGDYNESDKKVGFQKEKTKTTDINTLDKTKIPKLEEEQNISIVEKKDQNNFKKKVEIKKNGKIRKLAKQIFNIIKEKKKNIKRGRLTNQLKKNYLGIHDKFSEDNIIRKIKASFLEKSMNYINKQYAVYLKKRGIKKIFRLIQKISPEESRKIKKEENLNFLKTPLKKIFSSKLSKKCSLYDPDYNKKKIEELYLQNDAKEVINTLDKPVEEMFDKYCKNIKMEGFGTLDDDLKEERIKMEEKQEDDIDEYIEKFRATAINYRQIFDGKKSRSSKKKENFH